MIIDGEDGSPKRQPEPPTSPAQLHIPSESQPLLLAGSSQPPPPNYQTAVATPIVQTPYAAPQSPQQPQLSAEQQTLLTKLVIRESAERRFLRAFAIAVLVWMLLGSLAKSILDIAQLQYYIGIPTKPSSKDGHVLQCFGRMSNSSAARWTSSGRPLPSESSSLPKYISQLNIEVPTDVAHYLLTEGSLAFGRVTVKHEISRDLSTTFINVEARYYSRAAFKDSDVCVLEREGGSRGIGIYTPTYAFGKFPADRQLEYSITYTIPVAISPVHRPTNVRAFVASLPNFSYNVEPLQRLVAFDRFDIEGTNGRIIVQSLEAADVRLKTSNADVMVNSVASNYSVVAQTSNANVEVLDAQLTNTDIFRPATIIAASTNGRIGLVAQLDWKPRWPINPHSPRGEFGVVGKTTNGRLDIAVRRAPAGARIEAYGSTSNSPAQLIMHPTFEGDVRLRSSNTPKPAVSIASNLGYSHPMYGASRQYVAVEKGGNSDGVGGWMGKEVQWRGQLAWGAYENEPTPSWWGLVDLQTSNGLCALRVPCPSESPGCMTGTPVVLAAHLNQTETEA